MTTENDNAGSSAGETEPADADSGPASEALTPEPGFPATTEQAEEESDSGGDTETDSGGDTETDSDAEPEPEPEPRTRAGTRART